MPLTRHNNIRIFGFVDSPNLDHLFRCLSDGANRDLLRLLAEAPLTVGELVDVLGLPQSTVSRHLKALRNTYLVVDRREGNRIFSSLAEARHNGAGNISDRLNQWLREQPLPSHLADRLRHVLERREGEDSYQRLSQQWDELRRKYFGSRFHLEALCTLLPRHWRVLDIGTGTGYMLPLLAGHFRQVQAVDPSQAMLDLARRRAGENGLENVGFHLGRLEELPLESGSVDLAVAILVLHHAAHLESSIRELHRVLKPAGNVLVVDFEPHSMEEFQQKMGDPRPGVDSRELTAGMQEAGFQIELQRSLPRTPAEELGEPPRAAPSLYAIRGKRQN